MGIFLAIDLKSFYASVECIEKGYDPLDTNLVVADASRTEKTICLAVSPSLKKYGISGRARLFEVIQIINRENNKRLKESHYFNGESCLESKLQKNKHLKIAYEIATPRMSHYMKWSQEIYKIYLKYVSPEDIHVYSIDEVFMDITHYTHIYQKTPKELASQILSDIYETTGLIATAGIGTNLYLCKVAMDIVAKHVMPDAHGVRIAELDEMSYRKLLWNHRPLTDFWRVGSGYRKKLEAAGLYTMGDIARCSIGGERDYYNEELLYKMFGINAELLIDHAWGYEPVTIADIKGYKPETNSIGSGQVLHCPYDFNQTKIIVREMTDALVLDLVEKKLVTDQLVLDVGYDIENLADPERRKKYRGEVKADRYGRVVPKHAHGTANLKKKTSSTSQIMEAVLELYDRIVDENLLIRRVYVTANHALDEQSISEETEFTQMDLFTDYQAVAEEQEAEQEKREKERRLQEAMLSVKKKYGKNAMLKGTNLQEGATMQERNNQIGGHHA